MSNRNLDIAIARLLGLSVLGEAPCWRCPKTGHWTPSWYENDPSDRIQYVYLADCNCVNREQDDTDIFGHIASCLRVVSFYHQDLSLAIEALEYVCDERDLAIISRREFGKWFIELRDYYIGALAQGHDKSLVLAVCKALAGLEGKK